MCTRANRRPATGPTSGRAREGEGSKGVRSRMAAPGTPARCLETRTEFASSAPALPGEIGFVSQKRAEAAEQRAEKRRGATRGTPQNRRCSRSTASGTGRTEDHEGRKRRRQALRRHRASRNRQNRSVNCQEISNFTDVNLTTASTCPAFESAPSGKGIPRPGLSLYELRVF